MMNRLKKENAAKQAAVIIALVMTMLLMLTACSPIPEQTQLPQDSMPPKGDAELTNGELRKQGSDYAYFW